MGKLLRFFAMEYEYPNGIRVSSMCRRINGCTNLISETIVGTKGTAYSGCNIVGDKSFEFEEDVAILSKTQLI